MILTQVQDYIDLIKDQILQQIKTLVIRRPTRSLSAGAVNTPRDLVSFKSNQNAFISIYNLILDSYIRIRFAFQALDEVWLFLLERCFPMLESIQAPQTGFSLFEQVHK